MPSDGFPHCEPGPKWLGNVWGFLGCCIASSTGRSQLSVKLWLQLPMDIWKHLFSYHPSPSSLHCSPKKPSWRLNLHLGKVTAEFHWMFSYFCSRKWKYVNYMLVYKYLLHGFPGLFSFFSVVFRQNPKGFLHRGTWWVSLWNSWRPDFPTHVSKETSRRNFRSGSACDFSAIWFFHHIQILKDSLLNEQTTILNWKKTTIFNLLPPTRGGALFLLRHGFLFPLNGSTSQRPYAVFFSPKIFRRSTRHKQIIHTFSFPTLQSFSTCFWFSGESSNPLFFRKGNKNSLVMLSVTDSNLHRHGNFPCKKSPVGNGSQTAGRCLFSPKSAVLSWERLEINRGETWNRNESPNPVASWNNSCTWNKRTVGIMKNDETCA